MSCGKGDIMSCCEIRLDCKLPCFNCVYYDKCQKNDFLMKNWYEQKKRKEAEKSYDDGKINLQ